MKNLMMAAATFALPVLVNAQKPKQDKHKLCVSATVASASKDEIKFQNLEYAIVKGKNDTLYKVILPEGGEVSTSSITLPTINEFASEKDKAFMVTTIETTEAALRTAAAGVLTKKLQAGENFSATLNNFESAFKIDPKKLQAVGKRYTAHTPFVAEN